MSNLAQANFFFHPLGNFVCCYYLSRPWMRHCTAFGKPNRRSTPT